MARRPDPGLAGIAAHVQAARAVMNSGEGNTTRKAIFFLIDSMEALLMYLIWWERGGDRER